jgi:hypothetical protein
MREDMYKVIVERPRRGKSGRNDSGLSQELYVDPRTGLIRSNKNYRSWRHTSAERRRRELADIARRRRVVNASTMLLLLDELWFCVEVDVLPKERVVESVIDGKLQRSMKAECRYDVAMRRTISRARLTDRQQCEHLYGAGDLYAVSKRQISAREIKAHGLY